MKKNNTTEDETALNIKLASINEQLRQLQVGLTKTSKAYLLAHPDSVVFDQKISALQDILDEIVQQLKKATSYLNAHRLVLAASHLSVCERLEEKYKQASAHLNSANKKPSKL